MASRRWFQQATIIAGAEGVRGLLVTRETWRQAIRDLAAGAARLIAIWAESDAYDAHCVRAAFAAEPGILVLMLPITGAPASYPGIEDYFPAADRMQRAIRDLHGLASGNQDTRPWLRHASWPSGFLPLVPGAVPEATQPIF